jgi:thiamine transport system permease protein
LSSLPRLRRCWATIGLLNRTLQSMFNLDGPPIQILQTVWIIIIAHAFFNVAVVVRTVGGFWANLSPSLPEAAAVLGAGPRRLWREVTLPLLTPSIIAASLLVFLCSASLALASS